MKSIFNFRNKHLLYLSLGLLFILVNGCKEDENSYYYDGKYLVNLDVYVSHPNPNTGNPYTEEELTELTYDPLKKESYLEGQMVDLTLVSASLPSEVKVVGEDDAIIETITDFSESDGVFHARNFQSSLEELGLTEPDQKAKIFFKVTYPGGPPVVTTFEVKRIAEAAEQSTFYTFLKKATGETLGLLVEEELTSVSSDGQRGSILTFDGIDDRVRILNNNELNFRGTEDFSVGIWVNTTSSISDPAIISDKDWGSGSNPGFVFSFTGGTWKLNAADGSNRIDINDLGPVNDGEWHFLLVSFDRDGNATAYQDGVEVGSADMSSLGDMTSSLPIYLGQDGTGNYSYGYWYEGMLGQAYIFDYALTSQDAAELYDAELPTGAQLTNENGAITNINVTNDGGVVTTMEGNKTVFTYDGIDDLTTWSNPSSLDFRGTEDFSISVWVNTTSTNDDPSIIADKDWGSGGNPGFILAYTGGTWKLNVGDGSNRIDINGLGPVNDGEWHQLVVTFDRDGDAVAYQDGVEVGSADMSGIGDITSGYPIRLGQDGTGNYSYGYWFEGKLANSTIFNHALTAEQVGALYN
ncbi:Concanavalin A-like lectin/glucanases superfamily protein [Zhouia amylolytica]|uniref:Concanavalin A-like lectin/glucanases superfamily protein n=1 Tax=Zhouia amylolytica TaxID=376730 RepID=A0A1I6QUH0_9FLAO|nr:LamG domain-containing protein [Zhouia amylolytica]SFS56093.1 Concanavalin A-like lectin/glucanases superfamily protein [Zhouia amylolytica]